MRRVILAGLAVMAAAMVFDVPTVQAQVSTPKNPWCIRDGVAGGGSWDCSYYTLQQCQDSARGAGGSCSRNPNYRGGRQPDTRRDQRWDR